MTEREKDRRLNHLIKSRPVANAGIYLAGPEDHKTPAYKRGMRQLAEWHKQCAERRAKAAREAEKAAKRGGAL